jgi:hypothetical protein
MKIITKNFCKRHSKILKKYQTAKKLEKTEEVAMKDFKSIMKNATHN